MTTPIFSIPELAAGVASPEAIENGKTRREEVYIARKVLARNQNAPAGGEAEGSAYIVGSTPTGAFDGFTAGNFAALINGTWYQLAVPTDYRNSVYSVADGLYYARLSGTWTEQPAGLVDSVNGASGTVVLTADDIGIGATYEVPTIADLTKLDGIETAADVTDEANVTAAISGATWTDIGTPASTDRIVLQDASDANNVKVAKFSEFAGSVDINGLTEEAAYEGASDTLIFYDVSAGTNRKIKFNDLPGSSGGDAWSDPVDSSIVPGVDSTYNIGSSANRFATAYLDDVTITSTLDVGTSATVGTDLGVGGTIDLTGDLLLNEKSDHTETPAAGKSLLWAKNNAPSDLMVTDDAGTDTNLSRPEVTHLTKTTDQTGITSVEADVQWETEVVDELGAFDSGTSTTKITPGVGRFDISATLRIFDVTVSAYLDFGIRRYNSSDVLQETVAYDSRPVALAGGAAGGLASLSAVAVKFNSGDYFKCICGSSDASWTIRASITNVRVKRVSWE